MFFGIEERFQICRKYGWNLLAYYIYQIVGLYISQRTVVTALNRLLGFEFCDNCNHFKTKAAVYYTETKHRIVQRIVSGNLIHADETRANIKGTLAYVWVLTNTDEVAYILSDTREGELVQNILSEFRGVLVSDFYSTYDSIDCRQQRCLIHLIRDLNDEMLNNPFDEEFKQLVIAFGDLLKPMIETVDSHGLKTRFLKKHLASVELFYRQLSITVFQSEAASKCKQRFDKNRDKLFTFLSHDGVSWHNNNAEHAIKAFARLRELIGGSSTNTGLDEYLTLLSISQTCEYSGLDFLEFLRSGETDIKTFAKKQPRRRRTASR